MENFSTSFSLTKLFDIDLGHHVLRNLDVKELVAVERVNRKVQTEVQREFVGVIQLAVCQQGAIRTPKDFCLEPGHQFSCGTICRAAWTSSNLPPLIRKLPNLEAIFIGGEVADILKVFEALANCTNLVHVAVPNATESQMKHFKLSNLECIECVHWYPTVEECPKLKYIDGADWPYLDIVQNIVKHFDNGLLGISNVYLEMDMADILQHGSKLKVLNITAAGDQTSEQVTAISSTFKGLRTFRVRGGKTFTDPLNENALNLVNLHWEHYDFSQRSLDEYLSNLTIGHRLEKINLEINLEGDLIKGLLQFCPGLKELAIGYLVQLEHLESRSHHSALEVLEVSLRTNMANFELLMARLPSLKTFRAIEVCDETPGMTTQELANWIKEVKNKKQRIKFDIATFSISI